MQNQNWRRVTVVAIAAVLAVSFMTAAQALPLAGTKRPATVPADYVITPFGYFDPSCVTHLAKGDVMRRDISAIEHANGTYDKMHVCAFAHYKADGEEVTGDERAVAKQPTVNGWVEDAAVTTTSSYSALFAYWNVPPAPKTNHGQTVFLFNGMEDYNDAVTIIQPVLGWNSDYASAWGIASWNCCVSGTVFEATPSPVNSGDMIEGFMVETCGVGTKSCASWDIATVDMTSGAQSDLLNTSSFGQTFNWAFGGVLEVYGIVQCSDYPSVGINFYDESLYNYEGGLIAKPKWSIANLSSGFSPQCGYGGSLTQAIMFGY